MLIIPMNWREHLCCFNIAVDIESFDDTKNTIEFKSSWKTDFDKLSTCLQNAGNNVDFRQIISILCKNNAKSFRKSVQDLVLDAEDVSEKIPNGFKEEWSLLSKRLADLEKEIKPAV